MNFKFRKIVFRFTVLVISIVTLTGIKNVNAANQIMSMQHNKMMQAYIENSTATDLKLVLTFLVNDKETKKDVIIKSGEKSFDFHKNVSNAGRPSQLLTMKIYDNEADMDLGTYSFKDSKFIDGGDYTDIKNVGGVSMVIEGTGDLSLE